jgi:hypothetical protein
MSTVEPTLVILAAGMGTRYGGLKQVEPVGPGGATIMDYSIHDALHAGFGKVVFVIRQDMERAFRTSVGRRFERHTTVEYALQRLDALPAGFRVPQGRTKPWGTGHAVLAAEECVDRPFAVVNADDFYGRSAFAAVGAFLAEEQDSKIPTYAMVGYALSDTLSDTGSVSRGVCRRTPEGWLEGITEIAGLVKSGRDGTYTDCDGVEQVINGDAPVSMNFWGFAPLVFPQLQSEFQRFLDERLTCGGEREFYLPTAVQGLIHGGHARVKVLPSNDTWFGVTNARDKDRVVEMIDRLVSSGVYPEVLWQ